MKTPRPYSNPMPRIEHSNSTASDSGVGIIELKEREVREGSGALLEGVDPVRMAGTLLCPGTCSSIFFIPSGVKAYSKAFAMRNRAKTPWVQKIKKFFLLLNYIA